MDKRIIAKAQITINYAKFDLFKQKMIIYYQLVNC